MQFVLFYESAAGVMSRALRFFPDHAVRCQEFRARGLLLMVGVFEDAVRHGSGPARIRSGTGSMGIFTSREAAGEFATDNPFVRNDVVARCDVRGWNEVLGPPNG